MNTLLLPIIHDAEILFRPFVHPKLSLHGRLVCLPGAIPLQPRGIPYAHTPRLYREYTAQRPALIISEPLAITPTAASTMPAFYSGAALREWKRICQAVHAEHCKFAPLLFSAALQQPCHHISSSNLTEIKTTYARAAAQSQSIGADAVVLHAGAGSILHQFLRAESNNRTDEYGGDPTRRARFVCECIHAIRKSTARHFPIMIALAQWDSPGATPLAASPHELEELLHPLCEAGVDAFLCTSQNGNRPAFTGSPLSFASWVRLLTHKLTIAEISTALPLTTPPSAEFAHILRLLHTGQMDLIAHRPVPATPHTPGF